jgi:hypothetical protein
VEGLLNGRPIDESVNDGLSVFTGFECSDDRAIYLVSEQKALIEALGRAWHSSQYAQFIEMYEVLAIEREEQIELAPGLMWQSRPDLQVRRKSDGALFIINLKTTKRADQRWREQWPIDQQTLSEVVAVEARLNAESLKRCEEAAKFGVSQIVPEYKLSGVIILGLVKGETLEYPKGSGQWYHNNPLIWAWKNESGKLHPRGDWTARYEWTDDTGNHRLGMGWVKREVWMHYPGGVGAWIDRLSVEDPALLEECVVQLQPILRNDAQVESWKTAVICNEFDIRDNGEHVEMGELKIDAVFPMSTSSGNCLWPGKCEFFGICFENVDPEDEQWEPRKLNHPINE